MKLTVSVIDKNYSNFQKKLIEIWKENLNNSDNYVYFTRRYNIGSDYKIRGLNIEYVSLVKGNALDEIVKMSILNFVYLMIKCKIEIDMIKAK